LAAAHIGSGGLWQCAGPHEIAATSRRGDEMPYLTELNRRSMTAGLKHLTRQDRELCCVNASIAIP
jgi:hypothetical protein